MRIHSLLCLAAAIAVSGCSLVGPGASGSAAQSTASPLPPGQTLPPAWTATATSTPRPPTATFTPSPEATSRLPLEGVTRTPAPPLLHATAAAGTLDISGWKKIDSGHAYFWLPDTYEVADLGGLGDLMEIFMIAMVQGLSQGLQEMVGEGTPGPTPTMMSLDEMRAGFDIDMLMAADKGLGSAVFVVSEPESESTDIASLLDEAVHGVKGLEETLSRWAIDGFRYPTARAILTARDPESGMLSQQAVYVIQAEGRAYTFSCQTTPAEFDRLLPVFERSVESLEPHPASE